MGRLGKWSEGKIAYWGGGSGLRWPDPSQTRLRIYAEMTVVAATTGNTVQFGGATGYFTTHIDGWLVDDHERTSATAVVAGTAASTIFTLLAGSVAVNTVRILLWGR